MWRWCFAQRLKIFEKDFLQKQKNDMVPKEYEYPVLLLYIALKIQLQHKGDEWNTKKRTEFYEMQ